MERTLRFACVVLAPVVRGGEDGSTPLPLSVAARYEKLAAEALDNYHGAFWNSRLNRYGEECQITNYVFPVSLVLTRQPQTTAVGNEPAFLCQAVTTVQRRPSTFQVRDTFMRLHFLS